MGLETSRTESEGSGNQMRVMVNFRLTLNLFFLLIKCLPYKHQLRFNHCPNEDSSTKLFALGYSRKKIITAVALNSDSMMKTQSKKTPKRHLRKIVFLRESGVGKKLGARILIYIP